MPLRRRRLSHAAGVTVAVLALGAVQASAAPKLTILTSFNGANGYWPFGSLIADAAGNLYGMTNNGGAFNFGTVFKLSPPAANTAARNETVLLSFNGSNGDYPSGSLIADAEGNLYGTTEFGGRSVGPGAVFKLWRPANAKSAWKQVLLASFDITDGMYPKGSLLADAAGNLYGTTWGGWNGACEYGCGTVFRLSPSAESRPPWYPTMLASFNGADGQYPSGSLIADEAGNLYGTTAGGGANGDGTVFELSPPEAGNTAWTETVIWSFNGANGRDPVGSLIADAAGNLYGTTEYGGANDAGTAFELSPPTAGNTAWTRTALRAFNGTDGQYPLGSLIADAAGNLFGTTSSGGGGGGGTAFELSPPTAGKTAWEVTVLWAFKRADGGSLRGSLIADAAGNLFGTAAYGGLSKKCVIEGGCGIVFELSHTGFVPTRKSGSATN